LLICCAASFTKSTVEKLGLAMKAADILSHNSLVSKTDTYKTT